MAKQKPIEAYYESVFGGSIKVKVVGKYQTTIGINGDKSPVTKYACEVVANSVNYKKGQIIHTLSLWLWNEIKSVGIAATCYNGRPDLSNIPDWRGETY